MFKKTMENYNNINEVGNLLQEEINKIKNDYGFDFVEKQNTADSSSIIIIYTYKGYMISCTKLKRIDESAVEDKWLIISQEGKTPITISGPEEMKNYIDSLKGKIPDKETYDFFINKKKLE